MLKMDVTMSNDMETEEYIIEELDSNDVPESELSEFQETQPITVDDFHSQSAASSSETAHSSKQLKQDVAEEEDVLITKFARGEGELPALYTKLENEDEEDDIADVDAVVDDNDDAMMTAAQKALDLPTTSQRQLQQQNLVDTTIDDSSSSKRNSRGFQRKRTVLSAALQGLMGEANLSFARGRVDIAEKICLEIIRQNPLASEPFFTLAEIYETRDIEKYLNFLTIAAHLNPHERDQWIRLAEMHIAQGNLARARIFYTKAIRVLPKDYDMRLRKARLLELMGESNLAMYTYLKMIPLVPPDQMDLCLLTAKKVAHHFHKLSKPEFALQAMEHAYNVCGAHFNLEDLNLFMELLILNKSYEKVLRCLRERTTLEFETDKEQDNLNLIYFCVIPDDFVPDFRAKLCVCLIHLHAHHLLGYLIQNVHEHISITDERLELYIDIAEALMQEHKYAEAIELLRPITDGELGCPAFVWLRQAESLRHLNRTNEAIESYTRVVELAPFCYEAKFTLSALLKQQGRHMEAVKALEQAGESNGQPLNARLLYERCVMLQQVGEIDEFLEVGYVLLGRQSIKLRNREEMFAAANGGSFYNAEGLKNILQMRNITEDTDKALQEFNKPQNEPTDLTLHEEWCLFIELIRTAFEHRKFGVNERICFAMVTTKRFMIYQVDLERIIILACLFNDDSAIAFSYLRELISKDAANTTLWNLLSLLVQKGQDLRYNRYVRRLVARVPTARQMRLFSAHYHLHCSSYKYALNIYAPMFKEQQQPLIALCMAVVFNQLSLQKKVLRKTAAVGQAIVFMHKYAELRAEVPQTEDDAAKRNACAAQQEINYNIGRVYHQAGLMHLAIEYYERGLAAHNPLIEAHENTMGLSQEIAFNLHLIYRANGNLAKARQYLYQYCVV